MLLIAFGTRPELLKIEPLLKYWKSIGFNDFKIWLTCQHEELCLNLLKDWEFKYHIRTMYAIDNFNNRLDDVVSTILRSASVIIDNYKDVSHVLVQGDTASAFACALAAFHRKIPIIHLEAGLRSFDNKNPYPEEFYRCSISEMADIHLCPTEQNYNNLKNKENKFIVGNTILDELKNIKPSFENKILITLHRRENQQDIVRWFSVIEELASQYTDYEFILPIHPNPEIKKFSVIFQNVKCIDPLNHDQLIDLLKKVKFVITDSGGIVEEATWFGKRIFLCREKTERPEAESFYIKTPSPFLLKKSFHEIMSYNLKDNLKIKSPFGDGDSCSKITDILIKNNIIKI